MLGCTTGIYDERSAKGCSRRGRQGEGIEGGCRGYNEEKGTIAEKAEERATIADRAQALAK